MRFVTWNVRSLYRAGSLKTVASEMTKYKLHLVALERSDGNRMAVSQHTIIPFYMEMGKLMNT